MLKIQKERKSLTKNTRKIDTNSKECELKAIEAHLSALKEENAQNGGELCTHENFAYVFKPMKRVRLLSSKCKSIDICV